MLLTKEIDNIKKITSEHNTDYSFPEIDPNLESYYIDYSNSVHQDSVISKYSSDFLEFKNNLSSLWENNNRKCFSKDILSSIMQAKDDKESVIEAIQLYNYMM